MTPPAPSTIAGRTIKEPSFVEPPLAWKHAAAWGAVGAAVFHIALREPRLSFLVVIFLHALVRLTALPTARSAFYGGLAVGYAVYAPHLTFFWTIFGWPAAALWTVLAFWLGLFVALARACRCRFGRNSLLLIPILWTGLEYFRSELYYLRFSWLSPGYAIGPGDIPGVLGVYGVGFVLMTAAALPALASTRTLWVGIGLVLAGLIAAGISRTGDDGDSPSRTLRVAGLQLEFPSESELLAALDQLAAKHPDAELVVLSEYTLQRPPPEELRQWCRTHRRYLAVGGRDFISDSAFHNTVFVINPVGEIVFRQAKSVPVQFFQDGVPAKGRAVWDSPWGRIGFCICYDLSYRRVTDDLIRLGAQAIVVPTSDEISWGEYQHSLHARVAPVRAAEYNVPIFRLASSGISQLVDRRGGALSTAPFPGQGETISGELVLGARGRLPWDHLPAEVATWASGLIIAGMFFNVARSRFLCRHSVSDAATPHPE